MPVHGCLIKNRCILFCIPFFWKMQFHSTVVVILNRCFVLDFVSKLDLACWLYYDVYVIWVSCFNMHYVRLLSLKDSTCHFCSCCHHFLSIYCRFVALSFSGVLSSVLMLFYLITSFCCFLSCHKLLLLLLLLYCVCSSFAAVDM